MNHYMKFFTITGFHPNTVQNLDTMMETPLLTDKKSKPGIMFKNIRILLLFFCFLGLTIVTFSQKTLKRRMGKTIQWQRFKWLDY